jgi:DNA polymerase/3'-5' exonuclease PolX
MSTATRIPLTQATAIAEDVCAILRPFCQRLEVAGSIRRQRPTIGDLEIVCIPSQVPAGLFGDERTVDPGFIEVVNRWEKVIGSPSGKHARRILPSGLQLDLFMVEPDSWGLQLVIRTGSEGFSKALVGPYCRQAGYASRHGRLIRLRDGQVILVREEAELFALLGIPYMEPEAR